MAYADKNKPRKRGIRMTGIQPIKTKFLEPNYLFALE
jgi:hypothetical protein